MWVGDAFGIAFVVAWLVLVVGGFGVWIWAIIDVSRAPEHAFRLTGREKTSWVLVVALAQMIGAIIWRFSAARREVKAAAATHPYAPPAFGPPAGWYPDPSGIPGSIWWDGRQWTGHRQGPPASSSSRP
jgi:hypothetical protein